MNTYIIWLGSFGFKGTTKENFFAQIFDANAEIPTNQKKLWQRIK